MLSRAIGEFSKINKVKGIDFSEKMKILVDKYNLRDEKDVLRSEVISTFSSEIIHLYDELREDMTSFEEMGIDIEEKAFYDILMSLTIKYDFSYQEDRLLQLSKEVKKIVDKSERKIEDICTILEKCSIDEISKYLVKQGKAKKFPDITKRDN